MKDRFASFRVRHYDLHMNTLSLRVRYRPIRIGWCVREGNLEDIDRALRMTHTLWGGRYNPLISINNLGSLTGLADIFRVDALFPVCEDNLIQEFLRGMEHLSWPMFQKDLFIDGHDGKVPTLIDVVHSARQIRQDIPATVEKIPSNARIFEWTDTDSLKYVFLAMFGAYPDSRDIQLDYKEAIGTFLQWKDFLLAVDEPIPNAAFQLLTPSAISSYELHWDRVPTHSHRGFYVGDCGDFRDIVDFWNLRAAGMELVFYDSKHAKRLQGLRDAYRGILDKPKAAPPDLENFISVWTRSADVQFPIRDFGEQVLIRIPRWDRSDFVPPLCYWTESTVLATISDSWEHRPAASFLLPEKPVLYAAH